jgi:hypothetical protein
MLSLSILRSGLFLVMQAKPKLGDQKLIIVFVIGGIQASEVSFLPQDLGLFWLVMNWRGLL